MNCIAELAPGARGGGRRETALFIVFFLSGLFVAAASSRLASETSIVHAPRAASSATPGGASGTPNATLALDDIPIRDPNIHWYGDRYYMTGTTAADGFLGYSSPDLVHWTAHGHIYTRNASNPWAQQQFWAPEMVVKDGSVYLFFSATSDENRRGTGVAVADHPLGPFRDLTPGPLTPADRECLDGHRFRHPNGTEYLIYVYEWVQAGRGEMWIQRLAPDFTTLLGTPRVLFRGQDAEWSNNVVDGPAMLHANDTFYLFWSSFGYTGGEYGCGYAAASELAGPYTQSTHRVVGGEGGHVTLFRHHQTGALMVTFHRPNSVEERAVIRELRWDPAIPGYTIYPRDPAPGVPGYPPGTLLLAGVAAVGCAAGRHRRSRVRAGGG